MNRTSDETRGRCAAHRAGQSGLEVIIVIVLAVVLILGLIALYSWLYGGEEECPTTGVIWVGLDPESPVPVEDSIVFVCPRERFGLQWETQDADSVTVVGVGAVEVDGSRVLTASESVTYELEAVGSECTVNDAARVVVISDGDELRKRLVSPSRGQIATDPIWVGEFDELLYSGRLRVTNVRLSGEWLLQNCAWPTWEFKVTAPDDSATEFSVESGSAVEIPGGVGLAGQWVARPTGLPVDDDRIGIIASCDVEITLTLACDD